MAKSESIAEFLARGGFIKKLPEVQSSKKVENVRATANAGPATIVSMDDADLYHGEAKKGKVKKKSTAAMDISVLPEELRRKYIDEVLSVQKDEEEND